MLKISIQTTNIFEKFGIDDGFRVIHEAGFDCVDFTMIPFVPRAAIQRTAASIFDQSDEEIRDFFRPYKEAAEKYHVEFYQAHAPVQSLTKNPISNAYMIGVLKKSIMLCDYLNCPYLVVHPFFLGYDDMLDLPTEWDKNIGGYSQLIPASRQYGVTICLENMFMGRMGKMYNAICQDPDETNRYIDTLNEIAGQKCFAFCFDAGHTHLISRDCYSVIKKLGHRIEALHIHDNDGNDDQHLAPYMGNADWERFVKGMREITYRGALNFESHGIASRFPKTLVPQALALTAATGRMFARRIEAE